MREIMERYLLKVYTKFLEFDPLSNVDYDETYTRTIEGESGSEGTSNSSSNSNSSGFALSNDTPQNKLTKEDLLNGEYVTSGSANENDTEITDTTNTKQNATSTQTETYTHHMEGDNGVIVTNAYLIREFREIIIAVDEEIIQELQSLFMGLY